MSSANARIFVDLVHSASEEIPPSLWKKSPPSSVPCSLRPSSDAKKDRLLMP